jgi:hypothetical protein
VFFGGLARIDYIAGAPRTIYITSFAAADVRRRRSLASRCLLFD